MRGFAVLAAFPTSASVWLCWIHWIKKKKRKEKGKKMRKKKKEEKEKERDQNQNPKKKLANWK
jgi:hypothetical protein